MPLQAIGMVGVIGVLYALRSELATEIDVLVAVLACTLGLVAVFDDPAAPLVASAPVALAARRLARLTVAIPASTFVLTVAWALAGRRPVAGEAVEILALGCAFLALAAATSGRGDNSGLVVGACFALLVVVTQAAIGGDLVGPKRAWSFGGLMVVALLALVYECCDPASRWLLRLFRFSRGSRRLPG